MSKTYERAAIYVVAHQDDWQLFMSPHVGNDIADENCCTVIIHTTAGDAGYEDAYWIAREAAAVASIRFRLSQTPMQHQVLDEIELNGHSITCTTNGDCTSYFMRLPDGNYEGEGFERYNYQSLMKLRTQDISSLKSVDDRNKFTDWQSLVKTLDAIIHVSTLQVKGEIVLHFIDPDISLNPHDHCDHIMTAHLLRDTTAHQFFEKHAYLSYSTFYKEHDLTGEELFWKVGMFAIYHQVVYESFGHSTIGESSEFFTWANRRAYFRAY
ncbi:GlcNAc-PI de-N-acetylase [Chitinophaga skermanii]|uniref:GlcNAc-PI de-N-acetylase n=1 Tax=Chitinophaga skermanii TaxID=331697 RepID=A0A327R4Z3_9BACT|nr:PIG-L family deacetylase [Chitinophaga skermanii]RAJ11158.1 GlcNAc-PI de-N-acetylase [Chitinophaga skermanii]